jgi:hypothetical protein
MFDAFAVFVKQALKSLCVGKLQTSNMICYDMNGRSWPKTSGLVTSKTATMMAQK